jgi:Novel STAND NTPase 3
VILSSSLLLISLQTISVKLGDLLQLRVMLRYDLDQLGWCDFEALVQTLLKERLGLGIEAWGGSSSDLGRDAYYSGGLKFPTQSETNGPFLFQCKFVDAANAARAHPIPTLERAVRAECRKLAHRPRENYPNVYVLFTNVALTPRTRGRIEVLIRAVLPGAQISSQGGKDICAIIDSTPQIVQRFPQLMGLRDLRELLRDRVNADILSRSETALHLATELAEVFVPTEAYYKAVSILKKHNFVVLDGPPEMGKTAIGRMIALAQVTSGWEAIECSGPEDVLRSYRRDANQVFLADDFFGRTEYEAERVLRWERELPLILPKANPEHWLVVTSRAHLLMMGREALDIGSHNNVFPSLGEVVVDANELSTMEKARILYRHAKAANLSERVRLFIRASAPDIVSNGYYTPERIRRLIGDYIDGELRSMIEEATRPSAPKQKTDPSSSSLIAVRLQAGQLLRKTIERNLKDPSRGMANSFDRLQDDHRWLLFAFVESETLSREPTVADVAKKYSVICPSSGSRPAEVLLSHLTGSFIKLLGQRVIWTHPSCRDLVIDRFAATDTLRREYLSRCTLEGMQVTTSIGGGPTGRRHLPLLVDEQDWATLKARALELLEDGEDVLPVLISSYKPMRLRSAQAESVRERFGELFDDVVKAAYRLAAAGADWSLKGISSFYAARELSTKYCPTVDPSTLFEKVVASLQRALASDALDEALFGREIEEFRDLLSLLSRCDPSFLRTPLNSATVLEVVHLIVALVWRNEEYFTSDISFESDLESEMADTSTLIDIIDEVCEPHVWGGTSEFEEVRKLLSSRVEELESAWVILERMASDEAQDSEDPDAYRGFEDAVDSWRASMSAPVPTVDEVFRDL